MATARPWLGALAIDVAAVLVFATAGRQSHDEGSGIGTILTIAAPFLLGLAVGWVITPRARRLPLGLHTALGTWASAVVVGLLLRRTLWDRGVALSFVVVTALVLGALLFGWRALWSLTGRRQTLHSSPPPSRADR